MRQFLLLVCCVVVATVAISCGNSTEPQSDTPNDPLSQNEALWNASGGDSYVLRFARSCFCDPRTLGPVVITVENGAVTDMVYEKTGEAVPEDLQPLFNLTVDDLFKVIRDAIADEAHVLEVTYDGALGFPKSIFIDPREEYADDTLEYQAYLLD